MNTRVVNEEVLYADDAIVRVARPDIILLKEGAERNRRKRIRLCAHRDMEDSLHEMLIVHTRDTYVRPHKHLGKCESFHVIEGVADVVVFEDDGAIADVIPLGDYASGRAFYYRLTRPWFHTVLIRSDVLVFHETTNGPFRRADTVFAGWAPEENDEVERVRFLARLVRTVEVWSGRSPSGLSGRGGGQNQS